MTTLALIGPLDCEPYVVDRGEQNLTLKDLYALLKKIKIKIEDSFFCETSSHNFLRVPN